MITYNADHVGSLLRPSGLITAREDAAASRISRARFKAIEDRAVEDAIRLQERVGLPVITDGEQRRLSFQSRFAESVSGLGDWDLNAFLWGHWRGDPSTVGDRTIERPAGLGVVEKLRSLSVGRGFRVSACAHDPHPEDRAAEPEPVGELLVRAELPRRLFHLGKLSRRRGGHPARGSRGAGADRRDLYPARRAPLCAAA